MTPLSPQSLRPPCPSPSASLALLGDAGGEGQGGTCSEPEAELFQTLALEQVRRVHDFWAVLGHARVARWP